MTASSPTHPVSQMHYLTNIFLGPESTRVLPERLAILNISRPMLVTDPGIVKTEAFARVCAAVESHFHLYADTPANPTEEAVEDALAAYRAHDCNGIIALGGGSSIDLAKAVALLASHAPPLAQYALIHGGLPRIMNTVAPVVAVPTTAGTGSEVGRAALITLRTGQKVGLISPFLIPKAAICDPVLTLSLPPKLTAATGMDALSHCIETFLSPRENPVADAIALDAAGRAYRAIELATRDGKDIHSRTEMMTAAVMGGLCFQKGLGAVHSLSHALGASKQPVLHHGTLNAILLPPVLRANQPYVLEKYGRLMLAMTGNASGDLARLIEDLNERLGIGNSLRALGVTTSMFPRAVQGALADHSHATNPFQPTADEYQQILESVMG